MIRLALCFAALAAFASGSGYISGREYVYHYRGYAYSGYPEIKPQYTGYAYIADLVVQPHGDHFVFKLKDTKRDVLNKEVYDFYDYPYDFKTSPHVAEYLEKPFRVYFRSGLVSQFQVQHGEPMWSVNIKRSIISLFNLNFEQSNPVQALSDDELLKPDPHAHYYRVYEDGVLGECETTYVIEHHPYHLTPQNNIVLNVTKARNYHNCVKAPNQVYSTFYGQECGHDEHEKAHTLHGNAHYHYHIRGDRHHYVIEHVNTEGEVAYTPYPLEGQTAEFYVNRTLDLHEEREVQTDYEVSGEQDTYTSLIYDIYYQHDFKDPVDLKKPHYLYDVYGYQAPLAEVKRQFEELVLVYDENVEATPETNYPAKFLELVRAASTLSYDDIDEIYKAYADIPSEGATPQQVQYRRLFFDTLVAVGTNPTILYGKHLIHERKVTPDVAAYFLSKLPHHVKEVTDVLLEELHTLCEDGYVKEHLNVHVACYLAFSSIVHDHCVAQYHPEGYAVPDKTTCTSDFAVKYFNYIAAHFQECEEGYLKVAYVKAMGDIGVKEAIPLLRPYVEGHEKYTQYRRVIAIWALMRVAPRYPEKVRELVVPVYFNISENYELRLAAFHVFLATGPQMYHLEAIARELAHEEDDQVKSYVYSVFLSHDNSTHPCDRKMAQDAHQVLKILEHEHFKDYDYSFSHHHYSSGYNPHYSFGGYSKLSYFASDTGYVPRGVYLGLNDVVGGLSYDTFAIGMKQRGLEKFLDKLFGPEGVYGKRSMFDLFKKRTARDVSGAEKELREIKEKLNIATREYEPIEGEIFFKYMGNNIGSLHFNETTFESFFTQGRFQIPNLPALYRHMTQFVYQRFHLAIDKSYLIPSEIGVPILFDYKQPMYFYHKNNDLKVEVTPGFFPEDRQNNPPTDLKVHFDGHLLADKNLFASMGVVIPVDKLTFGVGINRRSVLSLPLKFDIDVKLRESKVSTKWTPVAPHEIYHYHYQPYTFIDPYINSVPVHQEQSYLPVRHHEHTYERDFFQDALGVGFHLKVDYDNEWNDYGSYLDFLLTKDFREKFYYLYANPHFEPYHITLTFTPADHDVTTEVEAEFQYSYHADENRPYTSDNFDQSGFEEYARYKPERKYTTEALVGEIVGHGTKERKIHAELTYSHDYRRLQHKINFYYDRTPFLSSETNHKKICLSGYMKYPSYDLQKLYLLDSLDIDHTVETQLKIHFGQDCTTDKKVTVTGRFETSEEQRELERHRDDPDTPEHYNQYAYYYQRCLEDRKHGISFSENCLEYFYLVTSLNKYTFHVKYENLTPEIKNFTFKAGTFFRHCMFTHSDHKVYDVHNPENEIHLEANFSSHYQAMDLRVVKPQSESHYTNVHVPNYHAKSSYPFSEDIFVISSSNDHYCYIEGDRVLTLDGAVYTLPPIDCYKVIAKDCSPNEHFVVLGTKINHPRYKKAVKVFLGGHKIEALPVSDDSDIIVRVDGKKVVVTDEETYFHYVPESKDPLFYVSFRSFYYALHSKKYGLIVEYDGRAIDVQVSPYYRSKLCGLCGNYNGQTNDPFQSADGCEHYDSDAFAYSFAIPSATCQVPEKKVPCLSEGKVGCTELRTHVVQLTTGKQPQTCFSIEPVPQCSTDCQPRGQVSRTVGYHCLPAKDDSTRYLLRQQQSRILHEVRRKSTDHESVVEVPEGCHRA